MIPPLSTKPFKSGRNHSATVCTDTKRSAPMLSGQHGCVPLCNGAIVMVVVCYRSTEPISHKNYAKMAPNGSDFTQPQCHYAKMAHSITNQI